MLILQVLQAVQDRVQLNDPKRALQSTPDAFYGAIRQTLDSGVWLNGPSTAAFCAQFGEFVGVTHCLGVANGSDALEIAFRALLSTGRTTGDEVVTVANAGGYASIAAFLVGLTPVYADIEYHSQLVSIPSIISCIGPKTAVVVATHLYGGAVDIPRLRVALNEAGYGQLPILEDCAQAHGARIGDRRVGSMGDIATFSFYPTKNLGAFGDAGAILTNDRRLMDAARELAQYGWTSKYHIGREHGRNSRLDEIQAACLTILLSHLDESNAKRIAIIDTYARFLPEGCTLVRPDTHTVAHLAVLQVEKREQLRDHLTRLGIASDIHYPVLDADQPGWTDLPKREGPNGIAVSRASIPKILTIPCFPGMSQLEIDRVCVALDSWKP